MKGKVRWFDEKKGYGFIIPEDGSPDVFVHYSQILRNGYRSLDAEDVVEFSVEDTPKGRSAAGVVVHGRE